MSRTYPQYNFLWFLIILNIGFATYATPIIDSGDASSYINFSQSFLGIDFENNFAHRSPFYSLVFAGFMLLFKPPLLYKVMVFFQYALVASTVWMSYLIFLHLFASKKKAMFTALLFNISLSTLFYANLLQTEILTVFFLILSLTFLLKFHEKSRLGYLITCGLAIGLLSLTRFNTVPLIFTFFALLCITLFRKKLPLQKWIFSILSFLLPYLFIVNAWCLYNNYRNGFYGLFPHSGGGISRNIIVASIRPDDHVSATNQHILDIFIKARKNTLEKPDAESKGSFTKIVQTDILTDLYSGFKIYREAKPELQTYFNLSESSGEYELSAKLSGFYKEIAQQNQGFIMKFRFISLLSSFRSSSSGSLPVEYGKTNLNILPSFVFQVYKLSIFLISVFVFFSFFYFIWNGIKNNWYFDFMLLAMFFIVFSFWGINFVFVAAGDANRFKFSAEPLIFGLFVYYAALVIDWVNSRRSQKLNN